MSNFFTDNEDLRFYLERGIDWEPLVRLTEGADLGSEEGHGSVEDAVAFYGDVLEMIGRFVGEEIAPRAAALDRAGVELRDGEVVSSPEFEEIFAGLEALGIHGMSLPRELGGLNCPVLLYMLSNEIVARADTSVMAHHGFHGGIALALLIYSIEEGTTQFDQETGRIVKTRFAEEIGEIARGETHGSMDITEPDAGSDMGALRCVARQDEEGRWRITGTKIFITSGQGKYHIVIARTEEEAEGDDGPMAGLAGLSTFLVPAWEEDEEGNQRRLAWVDRLEEKLGHHASATCSVVFEDTPAELIGERGQGFKHMLLLMNNARIGVGFESIGVCEAALRLARAYAAERRAFGKTIDQHELIAARLDRMEVEIAGLRALAVAAALAEEQSVKGELWLRRRSTTELERKRVERESRRHRARARRYTPLLKFLAAEKAVEMARDCVQIHGGMGYTREYGAEKLLRDAMVFPIYEGTSQIQALMVMKDSLQAIIKAPQDFVRRTAQARWRALSARDLRSRRLARVQTLSAGARQHLLAKTARDKFRDVRDLPPTQWLDALRRDWDPKRDFAHAMLHAERLAELLAHEAIAELLYDQARRFPDRAELFDRHMELVEPRCRYLHDMITTTGDRLVSRLDGRAEAGPVEDAAGE